MTDDLEGTPAGHPAYVLSDSDVPLLKAMEQIASHNAPMTAAAALAMLMHDYWRGRVSAYELNKPPGCEVDENGTVFRKGAAEYAARANHDDQSDGIDDWSWDGWEPTLERVRIDWPREKLLMFLWFMPNSIIGQDYSPCEATWMALADMDPASYTPNWRWQRLLWLDATVLAAWCSDNDLACPREWLSARKEAPAAGAPSDGTGLQPLQPLAEMPPPQPAIAMNPGYRAVDKALAERVLSAAAQQGISLHQAAQDLPDDEIPGAGTVKSRRQRVYRAALKMNQNR